MNIITRFHELQPSRELRDHATTVALDQVSRIDHEISSIWVHLRNTEDPEEGMSILCQVDIRCRFLGNYSYYAVDRDPFRAVETAFERAARASHRRLDQRRRQRTTEPVQIRAA